MDCLEFIARASVKESLRKGEIDYLETVSEGEETEFFKYLNTRELLRHLSETSPLAKKKKEVPTYVFVPDNPHYEGSSRMLFDERNHPVREEELTKQQQCHCRLRRCYKRWWRCAVI